jgi:quinohemoprotein ethanol dehydrogenase
VVKRPTPAAIGPNLQGGSLVAWNPSTQKEVWRAPAGGSLGGGTVTTGGNLVIQVTPDGRLMAYSADKGENLLEAKTGLTGGMGPPITFMLDGKQYVAFNGGLGQVQRPGPPPAAGAPAPPPPVLPRLQVYMLDGTATLPEPAK